MRHDCPEPTDLAALLALPRDDERRRAAEACPRCDALLRSLAAFLAGDGSIPTEERHAAERRLAGVVAGLAGGREVAAAGGANRGAPRAGPPTRRSPGRNRLGARGWGWAAGLAAAGAAFVLVLATVDGNGRGQPGGRLRGGPPRGPAPVVLRVEATPGGIGGPRLQWQPVAGADSYRLEFFTADLDTLAVIDGLEGPPAALPAGVQEHEGGALCRLRALAAGSEVGASALVEVRSR